MVRLRDLKTRGTVLLAAVLVSMSAVSSLAADTFSSIDDDKAYLYNHQSIAYNGMSMAGKAFWLDRSVFSLNPAAIHYIDDHDLLPLLAIGYDFTLDAEEVYDMMVDRVDFLNTFTLTDEEFEKYSSTGYSQRLYWVPVQLKHGEWLVSIYAASRQSIAVEEDSSMAMPEGMKLARADFIYQTEFIARVGRAIEIYDSERSSLAMGLNLRLVYSLSGVDRGFKGPNEKHFNFYSPIPIDFKGMDSRFGYAVDFGAAGKYNPLNLCYSLLVEGGMGQLKYVRTRPLYHMSLGWTARESVGDSIPKSNVMVGTEFCGMGEYSFDESFHLGAQLEYKGLFVRSGYFGKKVSFGVGLSRAGFDFHYAYFPDVQCRDSGSRGTDSGSRQGVEVFLRF